jgi:hypothetical protein
MLCNDNAFPGGTGGRTAMDRPYRIRRGARYGPMWARGFGARGVRRGVACLAVQLEPLGMVRNRVKAGP